MSTIVNEQKLLEDIPSLTQRQLQRLRRRGVIPYIKVGTRSFLYDVASVIEGLKSLETKLKTPAAK